MLRSALKSFLLLFILSPLVSWAQNGTIAGKVIDVKSQEAIIGCNVVIGGTTVGAPTDLDGSFQINNVKPGTYSLVVTYVSYKTQNIPDVIVESGKKTSLDIQLVEDVAELAEIIVTATREISTDMNLIGDIRASKLVVSGISSDQILKMPDRDAAQVMMRIPGVTISDNRFVLIRGVPERYNQVMINRAIGPSTEIDKRAFSFDLIPASAIDQMLVYKSGTAELPGDFAGGIIQLVTKRPSFQTETSVGLSFGYRVKTSFNPYLSTEGSSTDMLGFDNGFRDLPENFPTTTALKNSTRNSSLRERAGKSLTNNFDYSTRNAPLDLGFSLSTSRHFNLGGVRISNLTSISYSNGYKYYQSNFLRYNTFSATSAEKRFEFYDDVYSNDVKVNLMDNMFIKLNDNHSIEFKNLFVQLGEHKTTVRRGDDFSQRPSDDLVNYAYQYLSRTIYSSQLEGTHTLGDGTHKLTWVTGVNYVKRNEPDYRRFRTFRPKTSQGTEDPFSMQLPPSGNLFETGRFWSELNDKGFSNGANYEKKFGNPQEKRTATLKAGYFGEYKTRAFDARYLNYLYPGTFDQAVGDQLRRLPLDEIFGPSNINKQDGFVIEEGTTSQDSYEGTNLLGAGYIGGSFPLNKFDIALGFRGEYNVQTIKALSNTGVEINVENPVFAPMPFANVAFNLGDRSLVRTAYSRTVNRPEFRELAPFLYYQFEYESGVYGNPDLRTAFIHNLDLRWEMYPNPGELISVGAFYKHFNDPIETYLQITTETPQLFFGNAERATSAGLELEIRKSLASLGVTRFLRNTSLNLNAAWIKSEVNVGTIAANQAQYRPLQGQSPYVINLGVYYNDDEKGFSVNGAYNVFGPRIFSVGDINFPTWWEMPRHSLDFQVAKKWGSKGFETKLSVQNALNTPSRLYQDYNLDNKIGDHDSLIQKYRVGTVYSLGLAWRLVKDN